MKGKPVKKLKIISKKSNKDLDSDEYSASDLNSDLDDNENEDDDNGKSDDENEVNSKETEQNNEKSEVWEDIYGRKRDKDGNVIKV